MVNTLASFWGKPQKAKASDKKAEAAPKPTDDKFSEEEPITAEKVLQPVKESSKKEVSKAVKRKAAEDDSDESGSERCTAYDILMKKTTKKKTKKKKKSPLDTTTNTALRSMASTMIVHPPSVFNTAPTDTEHLISMMRAAAGTMSDMVCPAPAFVANVRTRLAGYEADSHHLTRIEDSYGSHLTAPHRGTLSLTTWAVSE
ncbi:hypothetical protein TrCOL_g1983 [Triparma columacea]|uniref:Uncharacterized protein n=1 Tax=Triparma columacea TaxID=722753 RepID=A0A9W7G2K8_9STRA|nr:hypothetical protein TrCOL_g1983 [Triparma columacea]